MGNASQINRSRNSVRVERRSDLNESDLGEVYCSVICHRSGQHYLKSGGPTYLGGPYGPVKDKMYWPGGLKRAPGQCLCRGLSEHRNSSHKSKVIVTRVTTALKAECSILNGHLTVEFE